MEDCMESREGGKTTVIRRVAGCDTRPGPDAICILVKPCHDAQSGGIGSYCNRPVCHRTPSDAQDIAQEDGVSRSGLDQDASFRSPWTPGGAKETKDGGTQNPVRLFALIASRGPRSP